MAILQLGRFRPANPFARAAGAVPLCEESQTWRLQADPKKTREVLPCSDSDGSRRGFRGTVLLQPVHQEHKPQGREV
jgi:hypothetical protein